MALAHTSMAQIPWDFTNADKSDTHRIAIGPTITPTIDNKPLSGDDAIGLFYDTGGGKTCGGYQLWRTLKDERVLKAFGSPATGFKSGDSLYIRVYDISSSCTIDAVEVKYDSDEDPPFFKKDGLSAWTSWKAKRGLVTYADTSLCLNEEATEKPTLKDITRPVTYSVSDSASISIDRETGEVRPSKSAPGIYTVNYNSDQCLAAKQEALRVSDPPAISLSLGNPLCQGGQAQIGVNSEKKHDLRIGWESIDGTTDTLLITSPGSYRAIATNEAGCKDTASISVQTTSPELTLPVDTIQTCDPPERIKVPKKPGDKVVRWSNGQTGYTAQIRKTQQLTATRIDTNGCRDVDTLQARISQPMRLQQVNPVIRPVTCKGESGVLDFKNLPEAISGGKPPYQFTLHKRQQAVSTPGSRDSFADLSQGTYRVKVTDQLGCSYNLPESFTIRKQQCDDPVVVVGNRTEPQPYYIPYEGTAKVYNRQGGLEVSFETPKRWFGRDGNGKHLPLGVYHIIVNQDKRILVTLIR
jgi:hypothetical protein